MPNQPTYGSLGSALGGDINTPGVPAPTYNYGGNTISAADAESADMKLFEALSAKHPDYLAWEARWKTYRDCVDDAEFHKEDYLFRNEREHPDQHAFRVQISEFLPDTPSYVERIVGALYNEKPKRDLKNADLEKFADMVTLARKSSLSSMDAYMAEVIKCLITYGSTRELITTKSVPAPATPGAPTRAEEIAADARPYAVHYTPLSVIDWDEDEACELTMVRIKESYCHKLDPSDPLSPHVKYCKFIQYDRETAHWWVFAEDLEKEGQYKLVEEDEAEHGMGVVPMVVRYWPGPHKTMIGRSFLRYMARAELSKFRNDSDMDYDSYMHAHPAMCVETNAKLASDVIIGGGRNIKLRLRDQTQEGEKVYYLEYPTAQLDAVKRVIEDKEKKIRRYAAVDPSAALDESQPNGNVSGVSRAWSFGTSEERVLSSLADAAADIEAAIFDLVLRAMGETPPADGSDLFQGEVQYPEEFEVASSDELLDKAEKIGANINSPTLIRYVHKRIARKEAGDAGQKLLAKIDAEIDKNEILAEAARENMQDIMQFPDAGDDVEEAPPPPKPAAKPKAPPRPRAVES